MSYFVCTFVRLFVISLNVYLLKLKNLIIAFHNYCLLSLKTCYNLYDRLSTIIKKNDLKLFAFATRISTQFSSDHHYHHRHRHHPKQHFSTSGFVVYPCTLPFSMSHCSNIIKTD